MYKRVKRLTLINFGLLSIFSSPIWLYMADTCSDSISSLFRNFTYEYTEQVRGTIISNTTAKACRGRWSTTHKREIVYSYNVDGTSYSSDTIHNGGYVKPENDFYGKINIGDEIMVYYSKNRPDMSVLTIDHPTPPLVPIFAAVAMSLITGSLMLRW